MKNYNELTREEKLACMSLYTEEAKDNEDGVIRQDAYRALGYTEEPKKDEDWYIRRETYRILGYTEKAKKDEDSNIRREAEIYFRVKNS